MTRRTVVMTASIFFFFTLSHKVYAESVSLSSIVSPGGGRNSLDASDGDPLNAVYVDADGDVGIGTTGPQSKLHIGPQNSNHLYLASGNNNYGWLIDTYDFLGGNVPLRIFKRTGGIDTEVVTVKNETGNVGIGTTNPAVQTVVGLHISNAVSAGLRLTGTRSFELDSGGGTGSLQFWDVTGSAERMRIDNNGNVGIGTTNPTSGHIQEASSSVPNLYLQETHAGAAAQIYLKNPIRTWDFGADSSPDGFFIQLMDGNQDYFFINPSGNVGIGTAGPASKLHVEATGGVPADANRILTVRASGTNHEVDIGADGSGGYGWIRAVNAGTGFTDLALNPQGGDVGIGTTNPQAKLDVNGNIKAVLRDINNAPTVPMVYHSGAGSCGECLEIGYDVAELFDTTEEVEVGDLLIIDENSDIRLKKSHTPYDTTVAGIVSGAPAILFQGSQLEIAPTPGGFVKGRKPPVALNGRVPCKVSLENGPIKRGDLLTSSSTPGHAMKATDRERSFGAIVGKALESLQEGPNGEKTGEIMVIVALQ